MIEQILEEMKNTGHPHWAEAVSQLTEQIEQLKTAAKNNSYGISATLKAQNIFTVISAGQQFKDMKLVDEWEQFKKFTDPAGQAIILAEKSFNFANVFNLAFGTSDHVEYSIVMASPAIGSKIKDAMAAASPIATSQPNT